MSLTKVLNSKANIKQTSRGDLPVTPRQPVINRMTPFESTLNQTVINLGFSIDTLNNPDVLLVSVDGKLLTPGTANDYTFTSIDSFGMSSQITLNVGMAAGLNVQAIKLGLKKETEFVQDARFADLYESQDQALRGFIKSSDVMSATTSSGTPAAGSFYSQIQNRSSIIDLAKDLKVRMGVDRMPIQSVFLLQNEFGPNGEPVFGLLNDTLGVVRFVGSGITNSNSTNGPNVTSTLVNDFCEITFYGTGINFLTVNNTVWDARATVDGGAEGSNFMPSASTAINGRNTSPNQVIPVVSGLSLGVHTVKIRNNSASGLNFNGFEIVNDATTLKVNQGVSYIGGKKLSLGSQQSPAYNSTFESGTLGTRGGRVIVYQKADGTIAKAVNPTGSQLNYTSADHSNEEVAQTYVPRQFGAGRSDDFSPGTLASAKAHFLDDGSTGLMGSTNVINQASNPESIFPNGTNDFYIFNFVGTGLDIFNTSLGTVAGTYSFIVDGVTIASGLTGFAAGRLIKVVSGLPYGSHTFKLLCTNNTGNALLTSKFVVYQPKKPTLPSGAVELADYNILGTYAITSSASAPENMGSGMIRKSPSKEITYVNGTGGTSDWSLNLNASNSGTGFEAATDRNNAYSELTFFGTGFEHRGDSGTGFSNSVLVSIQNLSTNGSLLAATTTNFPTATYSVVGTSASFNSGSGVLNLQAAAPNVRDSVFSVSGLPLALYKIRMTNQNAGGFFQVDSLNPIVPMHSFISNIYGDYQNTLPIGSESISDNRRISAVKDSISQKKNWSQAIGITSGPTTTSTSLVPCPDMSLTIKTNGGDLEIYYRLDSSPNVANDATVCQVYVNGSPVGVASSFTKAVSGGASSQSDSLIVAVPAGTHKVDLYWSTSANTVTAVLTRRTIKAREI